MTHNIGLVGLVAWALAPAGLAAQDESRPVDFYGRRVGAPGEVTFDETDNLVVQDHTYNRVWVINLDRDPGWLRPTK